MMDKARILIGGGGIGGLTTALAMLREGYEVEVYEGARTWGNVGAGVTLAPNAMIGFDHLGIGDAIAARSMEPDTQAVRHWSDGRVLLTLERGDRMRREYGAPYLYTHRADLHEILADAVTDAGGTIHLASRIASVAADAEGASITLTDGRTASGDLLVGADGVKSVVRQMFEPAPAHFTGHIAFRAVVPVTEALREFADRPGSVIGPGRIVVFYPLREGSLINIVFFARQSGWTEEGWTIPATRAELREIFAGWCQPVQTMIDEAIEGQLFKWAINARAPLKSWTIQDRIVLMGDAAHAMTPFMGQGASSAIEDAVILARALKASDDLPAALARYEAARIERTTMIQAESNANADRMQGDDTDMFGMTNLVNEETLGLFAYDCATVAI
ncbi:MAG: FAD-dependent monooxygenase [Sphingobium sp.]